MSGKEDGRPGMDMHSKPDTAVAGVVMMDRAGRFLLQRRDDNPAISSPGMIGMFGGHREGDETDLACALREVREETGLQLDPDRLRLIAGTRVQYGDGTIREGTFYFADRIDGASLRVTEGTLIVIPYGELGGYFREMVPTCAYVMSLINEHIRSGTLAFHVESAR